MANTVLNDLEADSKLCMQYFSQEQWKLTVEKLLKLSQITSCKVMTFKEAINCLQSAPDSFSSYPSYSSDLKKQHELWLTNYCGDEPVFIVDYPANLRPFYMARTAENNEIAACFDLLVPTVGEICSGSLREHSAVILEQRLMQAGILEQLQWYVNLRKFGHAPTGGFGLGYERLLQYMLDINNLKEAVPFPRWYQHCHL